ncbi:MAG TPA: hypothetical protein VGX23_04940 [Actinocrinis sp.]|nr:hypothetical protein [Actinocrinis sp.]
MERHPALAQRFAEVRAALDRPRDPSRATRPEADAAPTGERRHALAEECQTLIETIRSRPGSAGFPRPPGVEEMPDAAAGHGPMVMVNVSALRCDAVLLSGREVTVVPLPGLEFADCVQRADLLRQRPSEGIEQTLDRLADVVTGPVLRALGLDRAAPRGELPHHRGDLLPDEVGAQQAARQVPRPFERQCAGSVRREFDGTAHQTRGPRLRVGDAARIGVPGGACDCSQVKRRRCGCAGRGVPVRSRMGRSRR